MVSPKQEDKPEAGGQFIPKPESVVRELALLALKLKRAQTSEEKEEIKTQINEKEAKWKKQAAQMAKTAEKTEEYQCAYAMFDTSGDDWPCSRM